MDEPISKSQKKRDADALQKLGVELIALPAAKLDTIPLPDGLRQAIDLAKTLKSHGAIRRQAQLIGKLMRSADTEAIALAFRDLIDESSAKTAIFHEMEQWRDRLITNNRDVLTEFIDAYPDTDVQVLRQLIRKAVEEKNGDKATGAAKALFRFLRSCLL